MKTTSVLIHSLCVPCCNYCRYCLLSWNGKVEGADWNRSVNLAERFMNELRDQQPEIKRSFSFGYSMEHPDLKSAIRILRRLGGPTADFLQCDGMKMRNDAECIELMGMLHDEGIKQLNFTLYGLSDYHDRFAGRKVDIIFDESSTDSLTVEADGVTPFRAHKLVVGEHVAPRPKRAEVETVPTDRSRLLDAASDRYENRKMKHRNVISYSREVGKADEGDV